MDRSNAAQRNARGLASPDWTERERAAKRLGTGPDGPAVTRLLLDARRDPEPEVRKAAIESLGKLRPTRTRVEAVLDSLADPVWEVRWAAARALGRPGGSTPAVRRALERALDDPDPAVAPAARWALSRLRRPPTG